MSLIKTQKNQLHVRSDQAPSIPYHSLANKEIGLGDGCLGSYDRSDL